jgi:hypothetical protein
MKKAFDFTFAVRGSGPFPIDMLRFEQAYPKSESDSNAIGSGRTLEPRTVFLVRRGIYQHWQPEVGRWQSFRWEVIENSLTIKTL